MDREEVEQLAETVQQEATDLSPAPSPEPAPQEQAPQTEARTPDPYYTRVLQRQRSMIDSLQAKLAEIEQRTAPKPPAPPDPKVDIVGYVHWQNEHYTKELEEKQKREAEEHKLAQEREVYQEVMNAYLEAADDFKRSTPDFNDAYQFLVNWGHDQLYAQGVRNPLVRAQQQVAFEFQVVQGALQQGLDPAYAVYQKAIELGWQRGGGAPSPAQFNGIVRQAQAAQARDPTTGQFVSQQPLQPTPPPRSLSNARGGAPAALTPESILNMSPEEIDKRMKADPDFWRKLHGAR